MLLKNVKKLLKTAFLNHVKAFLLFLSKLHKFFRWRFSNNQRKKEINGKSKIQI